MRETSVKLNLISLRISIIDILPCIININKKNVKIKSPPIGQVKINGITRVIDTLISSK